MKNSLAYYVTKLMMTLKSVIVQALSVEVIKLFFILLQNKLECFSSTFLKSLTCLLALDSKQSRPTGKKFDEEHSSLFVQSIGDEEIFKALTSVDNVLKFCKYLTKFSGQFSQISLEQNFTKFYKILQNFTKFYKILQNFTKIYKILLNLTKFDKI